VNSWWANNSWSQNSWYNNYWYSHNWSNNYWYTNSWNAFSWTELRNPSYCNSYNASCLYDDDGNDQTDPINLQGVNDQYSCENSQKKCSYNSSVYYGFCKIRDYNYACDGADDFYDSYSGYCYDLSKTYSDCVNSENDWIAGYDVQNICNNLGGTPVNISAVYSPAYNFESASCSGQAGDGSEQYCPAGPSAGVDSYSNGNVCEFNDISGANGNFSNIKVGKYCSNPDCTSFYSIYDSSDCSSIEKICTNNDLGGTPYIHDGKLVGVPSGTSCPTNFSYAKSLSGGTFSNGQTNIEVYVCGNTSGQSNSNCDSNPNESDCIAGLTCIADYSSATCGTP
jgi:hypothetical protein